MQVWVFNEIKEQKMKDSKMMIRIWRKWEAKLNDLGTDLAVTSAMNEWHRKQVKKLNLHSVSNCKNFDEIDGCECDECGYCECKECGYMWNPYETEHFNFTCCEMCGSDNVDADF